MKKLILILTIAVLPMFAQAQMQPGNVYFDGGKMVGGAGFNLSGLGTGLGLNFEYGFNKKFGVMPALNIQNYSAGTVDWSFTVIDIWGTYHRKVNAGFIEKWLGEENFDSFAMAGPTFVSFDAGNESSSKIAFGAGAGGRYYLTDKISVLGEGRYRFASFKTDTYQLSVAWYSIGVGVQYAIN